jgi:hypothetical protein
LDSVFVSRFGFRFLGLDYVCVSRFGICFGLDSVFHSHLCFCFVWFLLFFLIDFYVFVWVSGDLFVLFGL